MYHEFRSAYVLCIVYYTVSVFTTQLPTEAVNDSKIICVFSKTIERREFPGPLLNNAFQHLKNEPGAECKTHHGPFALHHLVRERISELEENFK